MAGGSHKAAAFVMAILVGACGAENESGAPATPLPSTPCSSQKECKKGDCVMDACVVSPCTVGHCRGS